MWYQRYKEKYASAYKTLYFKENLAAAYGTAMMEV